MTKTRLVTTVALAGALAAAPAAQAHVPGTTHSTPGHEAALAIAATASNLVYFPTKLGMAVTGLVGGAFLGLFTGGDVRAAYAVWVPTAGGDYLVRPAHLDGERTLAFFGNEYADEPSRFRQEGSFIYDALYPDGEPDVVAPASRDDVGR